MADIDEIVQQNEQRITEDELIQLAETRDYTSFNIEQRTPRLRGQEMNDLQMRATNSEHPTGYLGVDYNQYFEVAFTKTFGIEIQQGMVEKAVDQLTSIMRPGWTFSGGGGFEGKYSGSPGLTPLFYLVQTDVSSRGISASQTVGGGGAAGFFATRTTSLGSNDVGWSAGGYFDLGNPKTALMVSLNVTDLVKGDVVFDVGVFRELPGGRNIEVSREFRPADALYDMFYNIFGGLADYRNYQGF
jgi:hypothetical protein